jgi:hypothetical protein
MTPPNRPAIVLCRGGHETQFTTRTSPAFEREQFVADSAQFFSHTGYSFDAAF